MKLHLSMGTTFVRAVVILLNYAVSDVLAEPRVLPQRQITASRISPFDHLKSSSASSLRDRLPAPTRAIPTRALPLMVIDPSKEKTDRKISMILASLPSKYGQLKKVPSTNLSLSNSLVFTQNAQLTPEIKKNIGSVALDLIQSNEGKMTPMKKINGKENKFSLKNSDRELELLKSQLSVIKHKIFNKKLEAFDLKVQMFHEGSMSIGSYIHLLTQMKNKKETTFAFHPDIEFFLQATQLESKLDFNQVEKERRELLKHLEFKMTDEQSKEFTQIALTYRLGEMKHTDFYSHLQSASLRAGIKPETFPALRDYMRYIFMSENVDSEKLFIQIQLLENTSYENLITRQEERNLVDQTKFINMSKKLVDFSLSSEEWVEQKSTLTTDFRL